VGLSAATGLTQLVIDNYAMSMDVVWQQLAELLPRWPLLRVSFGAKGSGAASGTLFAVTSSWLVGCISAGIMANLWHQRATAAPSMQAAAATWFASQSDCLQEVEMFEESNIESSTTAMLAADLLEGMGLD